MEPKIAKQLHLLNYQFYQSFATEFSETRGRLQPGVVTVLNRLDLGVSILDLGCGNGEIASQLDEMNFKGTYLGTDFSHALLEEASHRYQGRFPAQFLTLDLIQPDWSDSLPGRTFDLIFCFAVLHHIPGKEQRAAICHKIHNYLPKGGKVYLSNWQFLKSERLKTRILPWETVDLNPDQVEEGDYLLDWRRGGQGIRYVHHFNPEELENLAGESGFRLLESFHSDGKEGNLSLYQVWEAL